MGMPAHQCNGCRVTGDADVLGRFGARP